MSPNRKLRGASKSGGQDKQRIMLDSSTQPEKPRQAGYKLGMLAFGSLVKDPGPVLDALTMTRFKTKTPFPVEYGRISGITRGGAPTVVRHQAGGPVAAEVLVLRPEVTFGKARNALWNRERRKENSTDDYEEGRSPNSVLVRELKNHEGGERVLFADFPDCGKIGRPDARELARHAIDSVLKAKPGMDGITYLADNIDAGIVTPLTAPYIRELQQMVGVNTFKPVRLLARSVGVTRSVNDPVSVSYDSRLLHACLSSLTLMAIGHSVTKGAMRDWLDSLYGFLELTMGQSEYVKTQVALADFVKRGRQPVGDVNRLLDHLAEIESSTGQAWAYVATCVDGMLKREV